MNAAAHPLTSAAFVTTVEVACICHPTLRASMLLDLAAGGVGLSAGRMKLAYRIAALGDAEMAAALAAY